MPANCHHAKLHAARRAQLHPQTSPAGITSACLDHLGVLPSRVITEEKAAVLPERTPTLY